MRKSIVAALCGIALSIASPTTAQIYLSGGGSIYRGGDFEGAKFLPAVDLAVLVPVSRGWSIGPAGQYNRTGTKDIAGHGNAISALLEFRYHNLDKPGSQNYRPPWIFFGPRIGYTRLFASEGDVDAHTNGLSLGGAIGFAAPRSESGFTATFSFAYLLLSDAVIAGTRLKNSDRKGFQLMAMIGFRAPLRAATKGR